MKRLLLIPLMLLSLTACGPGTNLGTFISTATSTVTNPVTATDIYRAKNTYAATLELANAYRSYCWSKPYAALMADPIAKPVCQSRRSVVRSIQSAQLKAGSAIRVAEDFVRNNPTLDASSLLSLAWTALTAFQNAVPRVSG